MPQGLCRRFLVTAYQYSVTVFVLFGAATNVVDSQILSEQNLEGLLTKSEWLSIIGNSNSEKPKFSITYPNHYPPNEKDDLVHRLQINVPNFGRNFDLELVPNRNLVTDDLRILETFTNGSTRSLGLDEGESSDCYFRGDRAALSLCGGVVKGIVHTDQEEYYIIHPLPKRFHNESGTSPHVIVRRKHSNACHHHLSRRHLSILPKNDSLSWQKTKDMNHINDNNNSKNIPKTKDILRKKSKINESSLKHYNSRTKREIIFPLGTPVFVETAVFVDRDLFDHMKSNYPVDTERELIRFVLAMINAVQLLYHDPSLGRPVNFVLKRLEIMKEEAAGLLRPPDIDRFLSNFCTWQRTRNPAGDREPQHWDHALILTGLDLYVRGKHGKISNQVVGLAPVAGMCTATSSCTVNEGRHFESVYVVAHEIGHNLGMRHDGPLADNDCDPTSYIMSPTLGSGKITWSPCSRRYLQTFLETSQSRCLLDHGSSAGQLDHSAEGALPGERFDSNQQCMLKYGRGSRHSSQQPLDDVCRDLHCERERYTWTSHPALEGTMCGHNMWCRGGRCLARGYPVSAAYTNSNSQSGSSHPSRSESIVPGGWSKWRSYSDCASGCLFGEEGRLRSGSTGIMVSTRMCNSPRPQNGGDYCQGVSKRYQACNSQQCLNVPRLTVKEFAEQICTRAKDVDKDLTGSGMQKISSDSEEACLVWCQKRNGGTKSRGWTFPDGTVCQTTSSPTTTSGSNGHVTTTTTKNRYYSNKHLLTTDGYCINGRCEEFTCDPYNEDENVMFAQMAEMCPKPTPPPPSLNSKNNQNGGGSRNNNNLDRNDDFDYKNNNNKNADNNNYNEIIFKTGLSRTRPQNSQNGFYNTGGIIKWKSASGCHFNCISPGTGIRLVVSKGKYSKSSIQLCQPDQFGCSRIKSPFQHASMICNKYKERVRRLSGLGMQISPVLEDPDRPCRVACQDENISHRFYLVNGEEGWFPFGTDCSRNSASTTSSSSSSVTTVDKKAFCISGKCLEFGQDDTPLSQSEFTLPLLSRSRRSLQKNNTRVTAKLDQRQLDEIVHALNRTLTGGTTATRNGNFRPSDYRFDIDLDNPVHVNMDEDPSTNVQYYNNYNDYNSRDYNNYGRSQDYWNYA